MTVAIVKYTTYASILAQLITGAIGVRGIAYSLPPPHGILVDALRIEMFVQAIELLFYTILVMNFNIFTMATIRYYDWFLTTPLMLFSTCITYQYLGSVRESYQSTEKSTATPLTLKEFLKIHQKSLWVIFFANLGMLYFGYMGETGNMDIPHASLYGFICLAASMYTIYKEFGIYIKDNIYLFYLLVGVWTLYGVVYLLSPIYKNIIYNFLDIIAKNFFGIFLYYKIRTIASTLS